LPVTFTDLGEQRVKNIAQPLLAYKVCSNSAPAAVAPSLPLPDKPSIAVLPFQNMSGDPEQEFFADGIAEDIITALSRYPSLFVIARNSSFTYKGRAVDVKQVGRELGVRYALEGSVRKASNRVRITAQLVEAEAGSHVWANRYDRDRTSYRRCGTASGDAKTAGRPRRLVGLSAWFVAFQQRHSRRQRPRGDLLSESHRSRPELRRRLHGAF